MKLIRFAVLSALVGVSVSCGPPQNLGRTDGREDIIQVKDDDEEMNAAMEQARKAFSDLSEDTFAENFMVKAYFFDKATPDEGEHMWVSDIKSDGTTISGILQSRPGKVPNLNAGDSVDFPLEQLSDWLWIKDGKAHGAYTVQLLRSRMAPEELEAHDSNYPFSFE